MYTNPVTTGAELRKALVTGKIEKISARTPGYVWMR